MIWIEDDADLGGGGGGSRGGFCLSGWCVSYLFLLLLLLLLLNIRLQVQIESLKIITDQKSTKIQKKKKKKRKMRRVPLLGGLLYFRSSGSASVSEIQNCENSRCFSVVSVVSLLSWLTPLSLSSFFFFLKVSTFSFPLSNFRIISDDEVRKKEQRNGSAGIIAITAKMESKRGRNGAMGGGREGREVENATPIITAQDLTIMKRSCGFYERSGSS